MFRVLTKLCPVPLTGSWLLLPSKWFLSLLTFIPRLASYDFTIGGILTLFVIVRQSCTLRRGCPSAKCRFVPTGNC